MKDELLEAAYLAGFNASGEGYNGEFPFDDRDQKPQHDPAWCKDRDNAITAIKQARLAPVQELVAFNAGVPLLYPEMKDGETISVEYTTPPAAQPATEVLRLSKDGIWANPDIPADDAAKLVLEAIDHNIKILVQKAVLAEREACAKVCEQSDDDGEGPDCWGWHSKDYATAIRARSKD